MEKQITKDDFSVPQTKDDFSVPQTKDDFSVPQTKDDFSVPQTKDDFSVPQTKDDFSVPQTKDDFSVPQTKDDFSIPQTKDDFSIPLENSLFEAKKNAGVKIEKSTKKSIIKEVPVPSIVVPELNTEHNNLRKKRTLKLKKSQQSIEHSSDVLADVLDDQQFNEKDSAHTLVTEPATFLQHDGAINTTEQVHQPEHFSDNGMVENEAIAHKERAPSELDENEKTQDNNIDENTRVQDNDGYFIDNDFYPTSAQFERLVFQHAALSHLKHDPEAKLRNEQIAYGRKMMNKEATDFKQNDKKHFKNKFKPNKFKPSKQHNQKTQQFNEQQEHQNKENLHQPKKQITQELSPSHKNNEQTGTQGAHDNSKNHEQQNTMINNNELIEKKQFYKRRSNFQRSRARTPKP